MPGKGSQSKRPRDDLPKTQQHNPDAPSERHLIATVESYQGLLPHPDMVKSWEDVLPGSFERILIMAERDQDVAIEREKHTMAMEKFTLEANKDFGHREFNLARSGQLSVFGGVALALGGAVFLLAKGIDIAGYVTLAGALVPIVMSVIRQTSRSKRNTPEK